MSRATSSTMVPGRQLFSYVECNDWSNGANRSTFSFVGGVTSGFDWDIDCTSTLKYWENGVGHDLASGSGRYNGYNDMQLANSGGYFDRQSSDRLITLECYSSCSLGDGSATLTFTVPRKAGTITGLSATRVSDNQVNLSWTNPSTIDGVGIEVSIDGGSWSQVGFIGVATSYQYTQASAGHSYRFRVWAAYKANIGTASNVVTVTMTPNAPQSISVAASGGTNVTVTLANDSAVATSLEYQTSTDGGSTWSASTEVSGSPVTSFSTSVSGTALIRVRNKNATGVSDWLVSDPITTICPPAPPTLRTPSGSVYDMAQGDIEFSWLHNSLDGSSQTAYQLRYARNGGSWTILSGTTAQTRTVSLGTFTAGDSVTWQVRTKGADANYSDWSQTGAFNVYTAPTLSITSPSATITGMPISLTATYSDMTGFTCQAATASLTKDGRTLYSEAATINGSSITASLTTDEFLPTNGESYTVVMTARSSSGLQTTANATFTVDFIEPQAGELNVTNDPETGYASLLATFDNHATDVDYAGDTNSQYESTEGYVRSLAVEGKSEKWNQQAHINVRSTSASGISYTATADKITLSGIATNQEVFTISGTGKNVVVVTGHKYLALGGSQSAKVSISLGGIGTKCYPDTIYTATGNGSTSTSVRVDAAFTGTYTFTPAVIDLTAIYGAGNEPTALDDPRIAWLKAYALAHPAYDAGSLVSIEGVSVGDGTITTTLRSAGSVHDTLMADAYSWTVGRKVGVVDLGSLTWTYGSPWFKTSLPVAPKEPAGDHDAPNALCAMFGTDAYSYTGDKELTIIWASSGAHGQLWVKDSSYTDAAAFKTAMSGVMLYYELATPTVDTETSMSTIEIGSAFTVLTDLDSTFELTTWDGSADAVSISVARVNPDGSLTPLLTDGASGSGLVDRYAPLNVTYQYAVTTKASSQAVKTIYVSNIIESDYWFAYWGDNVAKAKWNPDNGGIQVTRPQKTRVYYAGRRDPVSYDGHAVALTETPSWMFIGKDEVDVFVKLIEDGGRGVYKSCDGWVYHADFDLTLTPSYTAIGYYGGASLGITRIAGERL